MKTHSSHQHRATHKVQRHLGLLLLQGMLVCGLVACENTSVEEVPVAQDVADVPAIDEPDTATQSEEAAPATTDPRYPWAIPEGWVLDETPRRMRIATYMAPTPSGDQEVAVTRFPGRVGGELANINRWRGQMGLTPIAEADLEQYIERFSADGFDGYQVRIDSPQGVMLAAGVFDNSIEQTWFVRATLTEAAKADAIETDFFAMAKSIMR
jgi:hypothetical protein